MRLLWTRLIKTSPLDSLYNSASPSHDEARQRDHAQPFLSEMPFPLRSLDCAPSSRALVQKTGIDWTGVRESGTFEILHFRSATRRSDVADETTEARQVAGWKESLATVGDSDRSATRAIAQCLKAPTIIVIVQRNMTRVLFFLVLTAN